MLRLLKEIVGRQLPRRDLEYALRGFDEVRPALLWGHVRVQGKDVGNGVVIVEEYGHMRPDPDTYSRWTPTGSKTTRAYDSQGALAWKLVEIPQSPPGLPATEPSYAIRYEPGRLLGRRTILEHRT